MACWNPRPVGSEGWWGFASPPTHQKNVHENIVFSLNNFYITLHYLPQVGTHFFTAMSPLWPSLTGKALKLFFSTSPRTLSLRFNLTPVYREAELWASCTPLIAAASFIAEHSLLGQWASIFVAHRLGYAMACCFLVSAPGKETVFSTLAGGFLTTGPPLQNFSFHFVLDSPLFDLEITTFTLG